MSAQPGHVSGDRSLIRRYAFLGFPGERQGSALSYAGLRAELGDENAASLVTRIGVLAQVHHLDQSRVPLSDVVARIMQSLTPDERRSIAQGQAIPPRIEAMLSAEAEMAKATAAQDEAARHNPSGAPLSQAAMNAAGLGARYAQANNGTASDVGSGGGSAGAGGTGAKAYAGDISSITPHNYSGTPYAATGLSYSTFNALRAQGFGENHILHAAQDASLHGFNVNDRKVATAFAVLDKDDGKRREERNTLLHGFSDRLEKDEKFQQLKAERANAKTDAERATLDKELEHRGKELSKESGFRHHIDTAPTARARKAGKTLEHEKIKQKAQEHLSTLDPDNVNNATKIAENYRRNPNDAAARRDYAALKKSANKDWRTRLAMKGLQADLAKDAKLEEGQHKLNDDKGKRIASTEAATDDLFASMTAPESSRKAEIKATPRAVEHKEAKRPDAEAPKSKVKTAGAPNPTA